MTYSDRDEYASAHENVRFSLEDFGALLHRIRQRDPNHPDIRDLAERLGDTWNKWKAQSFKVAVLAHDKSGKSTLINAMLGDEFLPAANTPETARIVRIAPPVPSSRRPLRYGTSIAVPCA